MKKSYVGVLIFALVTVFLLSSCDDSGITPMHHPKGILSFTQNNLKRLKPDTEGVYELWIRLDSADVQTWYSLGKFNIGPDGKNMVDLSGQPMAFSFTGDTNKLDWATYAVVSIEDLNVNFSPSSAKLISARLGVNQDSVSGYLYIGSEMSLDAGGRNLYTVAGGYFTVQTPSTGAGIPECYKGIWLTNASGDTAGLPSSITLTPGRGWVYEAWIADTTSPTNPIYYSMGRFYDPTAADNDGAGPCAGPNPGFNAPGQDWIQPGCPGNGKPDIVSLSAGFYRLIITIEPELEATGTPAYNNPFAYIIFRQDPGLLGCKTPRYMYNIPRAFFQFPEARLHITN